jgi:hypothetical protein
MYACGMRTTVDLPEELHRTAMSIARESGRTLSDVVADLMRQALDPADPPPIDDATGLVLVRVGHPVTIDDVRALDDE